MIDGVDAQAVTNAESAARTASVAAALAKDANARAQMAGMSGDAVREQARAEAQQELAEMDQATAEGLLDEEQMAANQRADDEQQRMEDEQAVSDARQAAMDAAVAARMAAVDAQTAADKVAKFRDEAVDLAVKARLTVQAQTAQTYADDADTAASMAEDARDAADMDMVSVVDAMSAQETAEEQQGMAAGLLMQVNALTAEAEALAAAAIEEQEVRDIAAAKLEAQMYYDSESADDVVSHYEAAKGKAMMARQQANMAGEEASRAGRARTNVKTAGEQATAAATAATMAEAQQAAAMNAMTAAMTANDMAQDAETLEDAEKYRDMVMAENAKARVAHMGMTAADGTVTKGAGQYYMDADMAYKAAMAAANTHVLELFRQANGYDITMAIEDNSGTATVNEAMSVGMLRAAEANRIGGAMATAANATDGAQAGGRGATVDWPAAATATKPTVILAGTLDGNDAATAVVTTDIAGVGMINGKMTRGFSISRPRTVDVDGAVTNAANSQVVVFTNKEKEVAAAAAVSFARLRDAMVIDTNVDSVKPSTDGGHSYPGTYTSTETGAIEGTFTCTEDACLIDLNDEGTDVDEITGYTFTGTRLAKDAVSGDTQEDYLAFGIWLNEATIGTDTFGAFAGGGTDHTADVVTTIAGRATYNGKAVGAHHITNGPVSFLDGSATLTADFGTAEEAAGTIEGTIHDIYVNGNPHADNILLVRTNLANGSADFNGSAVMGPQTSPGFASHRFNGTWSGSFFGASAAVADDEDTPLVDETIAAGTLFPAAVAGTFGVTRSETTGEGENAMTSVESFVGAFAAD